MSAQPSCVIAATLFLAATAIQTVRIHISNLLEKLGAYDRTHALVIALHRGIIRID